MSSGVNDAIAARSLVKTWRNVVCGPPASGSSRVQLPSPSRNATHVGAAAAQYVTATILSFTGGGATGSSPRHATSAAHSRSTGATSEREATTRADFTTISGWGGT